MHEEKIRTLLINHYYLDLSYTRKYNFFKARTGCSVEMMQKVNFRPDIRQNVSVEEIRRSGSYVALKIMWSCRDFENI